ncbi:MAG: catalase family peroxidase [Actinomycetota bacterium]|nr:catalase family peroxidase [Actinomycetota bacterium]
MTMTPSQAIDVVNQVFGRHAGFRALHAKGLVCTGSFTPSPEGGELTRAAHMRGGELPATFRFSNGAGDPHHADWLPDPRGMAVKLYLPDGARTDIVAVSSPRFPVKTPEGFIELVHAQAPGRRAPFRLARVLIRHPEAVRNLPVLAPTLLPRTSYAGITYYGIHAFKWIDATGAERYVRYTLVPESTAEKLSPRAAKRRDPDYLRQELHQRLIAGPVHFTLELQIANSGDPVDDPSAAWPKDRRRVNAGRLQVTGLDTDRERGDDVLVFDPTRVIDGIELSNDPVLRFRGPAYSESVARRMGS